MSVAQLTTAATVARPADSLWPAEQVAWRLAGLVRSLPWADLTIVATVVLEALHSSRPWHTAVLGAGLTGYLLAAHLSESGAGASVLRPQLPLLGAGIGLTASSPGWSSRPGLAETASGRYRQTAYPCMPRGFAAA
jgi:hypothetical protein